MCLKKFTLLTSLSCLFFFIPNSAANGKHKDWDDALTVFDTSPDIHVPLLVIGTKQDLESSRAGSLPVHQRRSHIAEDYVSEEIHLNCTGSFDYAISRKVLLKNLISFKISPVHLVKLSGLNLDSNWIVSGYFCDTI